MGVSCGEEYDGDPYSVPTAVDVSATKGAILGPLSNPAQIHVFTKVDIKLPAGKYIRR